MSNYINIKQYDEMNVTAKDDRILYDTIHTVGVIKGCTTTYLGNNILHVAAGYGIIKGALFEILEHDVTVTLAEQGTLKGQLYIRLDLSNEDPIQIIAESASTLTTLTQDENANFTNGIYEIQLCTFTVGTTIIEDLTDTFPVVLAPKEVIAEVNKNLAPVETASKASQPYTKGTYIVYGNQFYKTAQAIAQGDTWLPGTNIMATHIAAQLNTINDQLTASGQPFYFDVHDGEYGYNTSALRGADTFVPFKRSIFQADLWTLLFNQVNSPGTVNLPDNWEYLVVALIHPSASASYITICKPYAFGDNTEGSSSTGVLDFAIYKRMPDGVIVLAGNLSTAYVSPKITEEQLTLPTYSTYTWTAWVM